MNLFGYTKDPANRIVRFALDAKVQADMEEFLQWQIDMFDMNCQEEIQFDGKYKPDGNMGEVLCVSPFEDIDSLADVINTPLGVPIADPETISFDQLKALFVGITDAHGVVTVYIQHFDRRRIISSDGFSIFHSQDVYKKIEGTGLTLDNKITAKLVGTKLCFFSFFHVRQIFDMTSYYQEATDQDIKAFGEMPQVLVKNQDALIEISDTWVRRKLWLIKQSQILVTVPLKDIATIAMEFNIHIDCETANGQDQIVIPLDKTELKKLLRFLDEDYYKSPLSKTNFLTNSKRAV